MKPSVLVLIQCRSNRVNKRKKLTRLKWSLCIWCSNRSQFLAWLRLDTRVGKRIEFSLLFSMLDTVHIIMCFFSRFIQISSLFVRWREWWILWRTSSFVVLCGLYDMTFFWYTGVPQSIGRPLIRFKWSLDFWRSSN